MNDPQYDPQYDERFGWIEFAIKMPGADEHDQVFLAREILAPQLNGAIHPEAFVDAWEKVIAQAERMLKVYGALPMMTAANETLIEAGRGRAEENGG